VGEIRMFCFTLTAIWKGHSFCTLLVCKERREKDCWRSLDEEVDVIKGRIQT
jgi:hypothetical protein